MSSSVHTIPGSPVAAQSSLSIAVVGTGYWGKNYVRSLYELQPFFELRYVCDANEVALSALRQRFPTVKFVTTFSTLLADESLHAIVIATPASSHFVLGKQVLEAGKHLLVEKPMTTTSPEADELNAIAAARGLRVMVGFTSCFIPAVTAAKERLAAPDYGKCYYITSRRTALGIVRPDVNVSWDLVPHDLAVLSYLTGSKPVWLSAVGSSFVSEKEDAVTVTIRYENGVTASVFASWAEPRKTREVVIVGSSMTLAIDDVNVMEPLRVYKKAIDRDMKLQSADEYGSFKLITKSGDLVVPELTIVEPLKSKLLHFGECCRDLKKDCIASGALGAVVVKMLEAIDQSMKGNGAPVTL